MLIRGLLIKATKLTGIVASLDSTADQKVKPVTIFA